MSGSLLYRGLLIALVVAVAGLLAYPPAEKINLGLDLRGGIHLVLEVEEQDALRAEADKDMETVLRGLDEEGVTGALGERTDDNTFVVSGVPTSAVVLLLAPVSFAISVHSRLSMRWP